MAETYRFGKTLEEYWDRAFLIPAINLLDTAGSCRWQWWNKQLLKGKVDKNLPQIAWDRPSCYSKVAKLLSDCATQYNCNYIDFLDFLLYGLGYDDHIGWRKVPCEVVRKWEENLHEALPLMMMHPYPYFTEFMEEQMSRGMKKGTAFFATPIHVSDLMARLSYAGKDPKAEVLDTCCGTGNLLLAASNFSVNLYGQDVNRTVLMGAQIHAHLYMPWMILPMPSLLKCAPFGHGDSLWPEKMQALPYYVYERAKEEAI